MKPIRSFFFLFVVSILCTVQAGHAQWSIRPIVVTHDTLPRTLEPATPSGMENVVVAGDEIYFKDDHGIFLAKSDSIIPIVTEIDTIPGTEGLFDSFDNYGGLPKAGMWTSALGFGRTGSSGFNTHGPTKAGFGPLFTFDNSDSPPAWGGVLSWTLGVSARSSGGFSILGPRKVAFTYAFNGKLTFFVARPGEISRFGSLPDTVVFNDVEYMIGEADGISSWLMEESSSGLMLYVLWNKYVRGFIGDDLYSAFFSFDGKTVTKLLAKADRLGTGDSLRIGSVTGRFKGTLAARNRKDDQWMVQAVYSVKNQKIGEWTIGNGILLLDHGRVTSVVQAGDSIVNLPGGRLPNQTEVWMGERKSLSWQPDFSRPAAVLQSDYKTTEWSQGSFLAQGGSVKRLAAWKKGDELPGTSGGRIDQFSVNRSKGLQSSMTFGYTIVTLDTLTVASLVGVDHSEADISEGIFRWEGGTIRKLVVQGDSIVRGRARVVSGIDRFEYLGSLDELVFTTSVDNSDRALLLWSGGKVSEITSTVGGGVIDKRRPGKGRAVNFMSIGYFEVIPGGRVVFSAGNPAVTGWFLAERTK